MSGGVRARLVWAVGVRIRFVWAVDVRMTHVSAHRLSERWVCGRHWFRARGNRNYTCDDARYVRTVIFDNTTWEELLLQISIGTVSFRTSVKRTEPPVGHEAPTRPPCTGTASSPAPTCPAGDRPGGDAWQGRWWKWVNWPIDCSGSPILVYMIGWYALLELVCVLWVAGWLGLTCSLHRAKC